MLKMPSLDAKEVPKHAAKMKRDLDSAFEKLTKTWKRLSNAGEASHRPVGTNEDVLEVAGTRKRQKKDNRKNEEDEEQNSSFESPAFWTRRQKKTAGALALTEDTNTQVDSDTEELNVETSPQMSLPVTALSESLLEDCSICQKTIGRDSEAAKMWKDHKAHSKCLSRKLAKEMTSFKGVQNCLAVGWGRELLPAAIKAFCPIKMLPIRMFLLKCKSLTCNSKTNGTKGCQFWWEGCQDFSIQYFPTNLAQKTSSEQTNSVTPHTWGDCRKTLLNSWSILNQEQRSERWERLVAKIKVIFECCRKWRKIKKSFPYLNDKRRTCLPKDECKWEHKN